MKRIIALTLALILNTVLHAQTTDTLVDVGSYKLHFTIIKGTGTPILFEAGSGNDATVWKDILAPIAKITGTTIIAYDRAGMGKSIVKPENQQLEKNGIIEGVEGLELGLKKLGYSKDIILVAHSYGGFYSTLYAARNPKMVKNVVFLEAAQSAFYNDAFMEKMNTRMPEAFLNSLKAARIGLYFELKNVNKTLGIMRKTEFPTSIPVINIEAEEPFNPLNNPEDAKRWTASQIEFVSKASNRRRMIVNGSKHYVFRDHPFLVVNAIVKAYSRTLKAREAKVVLERSLDFSIAASNALKKQELAYRHSEANLNSWGYELVSEGDLDKALEIFKLNTVLYPSIGMLLIAMEKIF